MMLLCSLRQVDCHAVLVSLPCRGVLPHCKQYSRTGMRLSRGTPCETCDNHATRSRHSGQLADIIRSCIFVVVVRQPHRSHMRA
jgi:hypothetical protein